MIHTDFEKGFIRAETIGYDDFVSLQGRGEAARDAGRLRLEGKEYGFRKGTCCTSASTSDNWRHGARPAFVGISSRAVIGSTLTLRDSPFASRPAVARWPIPAQYPAHPGLASLATVRDPAHRFLRHGTLAPRSPNDPHPISDLLRASDALLREDRIATPCCALQAFAIADREPKRLIPLCQRLRRFNESGRAGADRER